MQVNDNELVEILSVIEDIIERNEFSTLLWASDINIDFLRRSRHVQSVQEFLNKLGLLRAWTDLQLISLMCMKLIIKHLSQH